MLAAFRNTLRIPELRKKILFTLGMIFLCRLVSMIPTPGVDLNALSASLKARSARGGGFADMFNLFSGGALNSFSIGILGIWPYISAQIILQLMTAIVPSLGRMVREGESGRVKFNQITRYLAMAICAIQGFFLARAMQNPRFLFGADIGSIVPTTGVAGFLFPILAVIFIVTASLLMIWLGEQITARGIGNGISLIIMVNITSRLPQAVLAMWRKYFLGQEMDGSQAQGVHVGIFGFLILLLLGFLVIAGTVMLTQGVRKIPIHSARRQVGGRTYGGQATYMPLRVNYSGVMPIIFAGPLLQFPAAIFKRIPERITWLGWLRKIGDLLTPVGNQNPTFYLVCFSLLIFFFSFFWVATQFNAVQISEDLKRGNAYIPGIRPGRATAEYLDGVMTRVTLIGAVGLVIVAILPQILQAALDVDWVIASFFGGTSLLIIVGVALDTLRQMESFLLMRHYDGFLKHGRLKGRGR
ncbi:MAG: preprotein translocase subunit SecY [Kiritimatiellia bacterium]|jgi:preprotein translocase subunit SecY